MELTLNEDQLQFQQLIRRFMEDRPAVDLRYAPDACQRREIWSALTELGVTGLAVPQSLGGFSGRPEDVAVVAFEIGRSPVASLRYENVVLAARLLAEADEGVAASLLERLVAGNLRPAFAAYERATEFDLSQVEASIEQIDGGYRVNGNKILVIDGDEADTLFVIGRMASDQSVGVVVVDPAAPGVTRRRYHLADFTAAADVRFDNTPAAALLFSGPGAFDRMQDCTDEAIVMLCAGMVGSIERSIERTHQFLGMREQFGRSLSNFQSLQHQVADLFIQTNDARSIVYGAISALYESRDQRSRAAAMCKVKVGAVSRAVTGQAVHLHGGIGFTTEYAIGHHFRRAFVDERILGDSDFHFERYLALSAKSLALADMAALGRRYRIRTLTPASVFIFEARCQQRIHPVRAAVMLP